MKTKLGRFVKGKKIVAEEDRDLEREGGGSQPAEVNVAGQETG